MRVGSLFSGAGGLGHADGPRYRLIGNGVVAPVAEWLARRILSTEAPS